MSAIKQGDWVTVGESLRVGFVKRLAKDGSWADVAWEFNGAPKVKRMKPAKLIVQHTINAPSWGCQIVDLDRKAELEEEVAR